MKREEIRKDEEFIDFIESKKSISKHGQKTYETALVHFTKIINKSPSEYIWETKQKQIPFIRWAEIINENGEKEKVQQLIEPDIERGELYKDFIRFYDYLENRNYSDVTIDNYITAMRSFLKKRGLKLPDKMEIQIVTNPKKILKWEKIRRAIEKATSIRNKAIIAFMASTGMRSKDVRNLKIKAFLKALELTSIDELFALDDNRIGYFEFKPSKTKKKGFYCKVGCSPYSIKLIIKYLRDRRKNKELKENSYLFISNMDKKFSENAFWNIFKKLDKKLYLDDVEWFKDQLKIWQYDEQKGLPHERGISPEKYEEEINNITQFHAHGLRAFFINTVASYCTNINVRTCMEGHKSVVETDIHYTNISKEIIKTHYFPIIPYLTFEETEVNQLDDDGRKELKETKKELAESKEEMANMNYRLNELEEILLNTKKKRNKT